jgi:hypothetical protein
MTVTESKDLTKGTRVYWRGDAAQSGIVTETSWDAVTIALEQWASGQSSPRGHARNSADGDKVAYCVKVTEIRRRKRPGRNAAIAASPLATAS